jgi:hypothetical protein
MNEYERIRKECFWDLDIQEDDIKEILVGLDGRAEAYFFDKPLEIEELKWQFQ